MEKGDGLSFAEFSYPVMQAWDWWYMYQTKGIQLQIGGSDQFGNIIAGIDAIKYIAKTHPDPLIRQEKEDPLMKPMGFTVPLLTSASGEKFGKSAGNAIWLDKEMTSPFDLHQVCLLLTAVRLTNSQLMDTQVFLPHRRRRRRPLSTPLHIYTPPRNRHDNG